MWITIVFGLLPALFLSALVSTRHRLTVPFCRRCDTRRRFAPLVSWVLGIGAVVVFFVGIGFAVDRSSWIVFLGGLFATVLIGMAGERYQKAANPRYITFDDNNVVIEDAVHGPVVLVAPLRAYGAPIPY
ncbi:MAG TPA: hypothetical protein VFJ82_13625 [Longimicrobium sp.]|nr:hypothetical protein [Longimicrobium sp.]